jgi:hypothetical protein
MERQDPKLKEIWRQNKIPVVYRRERPKPVLVKLPYADDNFSWLRGERRHKPKRNEQYKCWEIPVSWFDDIIQEALSSFGQVFVIQLYKELQKCAPSCWDAKGFHCECSCMGANHGTGHPGSNWYEVSDTFAFEWGPIKYACRLVKSNRDN